MATQILTRRGTGAPPNATLAHGELAVDPAAGKLYVGDGANNTVTLTGGGSVNPGTADGQTLRWEAGNSRWEATDSLKISSTGSVTLANGNLIANRTGGNFNFTLQSDVLPTI